MSTDALFRDDAYLATCEASVVEINERGGIVLDRTIFYPTGGGQAGDSGALVVEGGATIPIATTVYDENREIVHVPQTGPEGLKAGDKVRCEIDWPRRHARMRVHTAMHLLSVLLPYPVTGGQVGDGAGRLDFDIEEAGIADKEELTEKLNELVAADEPVTSEWISDAELDANPDLVKTMSVQPPRGGGKVRLIRIGSDTDLQPCGGTHVKRTGEIGEVAVTKIEKKGRQNRRVRIALV
jgi:misacylated tRNA(Ala) deacylase